MRTAIQTALGQSVATNGKTIGGVQKLFGQDTLMPLNQSGEEIQKAFQQGFSNGSAWSAFGSIWGGADASRNPEFWDRISGQDMPDGSVKSQGIPRIGGEFLPSQLMTSGEVRFIPVDGSRYRMEVQRSGSVLDVHQEDGSLYIVDFGRL